MNNLYGAKKHQKIQDGLHVKLQELVERYEDKDAENILASR